VSAKSILGFPIYIYA
jgi:hypothetical protein